MYYKSWYSFQRRCDMNIIVLLTGILSMFALIFTTALLLRR